MEIRDARSFAGYYRGIRRRTMRVAACIPADKIEWTYREGKFTLGDLLRHIAAAERYMFAENVQRRPSLYPGHGRELADGYDEVLRFVERLHEESISIIEGLSAEDLTERCETPAGTTLPVWKWLRAMVEHEVHHRGQIYLYLGMLGLPTPPLYGLTSEEVRERSV